MRASEIESQLRTLLAERLGVHEVDIHEETSLAADLGADSLDMVALIMEIEDAFDIDIPDADAAQIVTMKQLTDYVTHAVAADDVNHSRQIEMPAHAGGPRHR